MNSFLDSNFLTSVVAFVVGIFAISLYIKQKIDQEKAAARLTIQEIRYAEQRIRIFRDMGSYPLSEKLLPTNSWHQNIHLFVKKLKESEIDIISKFYSNAAYLDIVISKISDKKNDIMTPVGPESVSKSPPPQNLPTMQQIPAQPPQFVMPQTEIRVQTFELYSNKILAEISQKIEFIYNTPAVDKLRAISEKRRFLIF